MGIDPQSPAASPTPQRRSKRLYILWAIALTLLLSTGLFCWLVVVPFLETRTVILRVCNTPGNLDSVGPQAVRELGGPRHALRKLKLYLKAPGTDRVHKRAAAFLLGFCGQEAAKPLLGLSHEPDSVCRQIAAVSLGQVGNPQAVPRLIAMLQGPAMLRDPQGYVQQEAAWALWNIPDERAREPLARASRGGDMRTRCFAAFALGRLKDPRALDVLILALKNKNAWVTDRPERKTVSLATAAARALGDFGPQAEKAVPALEELRRDKDNDIRQAAEDALKKIKAAREKSE